MSTLNEPVYEVKEDSSLYKMYKKRRDSREIINSAIGEICEYLEIKDGEFVYYNSNKFGFYDDSEGYEKYKEKLTKNSDRNDVYTFKKTTAEFKAVSVLMLKIDEVKNMVDGFASHSVFGMNNVVASQWVGDRFFFGVKNEEYAEESMKEEGTVIEYGENIASKADYKEYLLLYTEHI